MTTGTLSFWDAAYPLASPPPSDGVCVYLPGGDELHAWTTAEVAAQHARYRLPVFVRSNPPGPGAAADVAAAVAALRAIGAPPGSLVAWDLETAADAAYIRAVYEGLKAAGYTLIVYGSQSTVLGNDNPDGLYWGAQWSGVPHLASPDVMTQWVSFAGYDESLAEASLPFWDTRPPQPGPGPSPAPPPSQPTWEDIVATVPVISRGSTGQAVKNWQGLLCARGHVVGIDGNFGPQTEAATIAAQRALGVGVDGSVGKVTWAAALA